MKSAIITGATGFIGSELVRLLLKSNIKVLALGRKSWDEVDKKRLQSHDCLTYLQLNMNQINLLPQELARLRWSIDDCVFYNLAWGGKCRLSDLEILSVFWESCLFN